MAGMAGKRRMTPNGLAFHPQRIADTIDQLKAENALRVQCPHCPLMILDMATHLRICHADSPAVD